MFAPPQQKNLHLHVRTACIAKLTRRERDPSTPHPCTTAPSTRHSRGSASTVASTESSPVSPPWPTHPGKEAFPDRKKLGIYRLAAAEHQLLQLVVYFQCRRPIAVCWRSLDARALCPIHPGVGRQPAPCLWLSL